MIVISGEAHLARSRQQRIQHPFLGGILGAMAHLVHFLLAHHLDRHVHQVADDGFDIATDIADLGELGRLDLDEGRIGQSCQAAGDLGFADPGRDRSSGCSWA